MPRRKRPSPRKTPRQERARRTVEVVLVAAAQVLARRGYAGATTDAIARRAGVSVGSIYQYFPNKDAIFVALAKRHVDEGLALVEGLLAEVGPAPRPMPLVLRRFVEAMLTLHRREPDLHRVLFEEAPLPPELHRYLEAREAAFTTRVKAWVEGTPGLDARDPALTAYVLVRSVEGLVHDYVLHPPEGIEPETFCDEVVRLLGGYVGA
jgi:AcrR family transcriptional regulator